jgi:hypothetical protein
VGLSKKTGVHAHLRMGRGRRQPDGRVGVGGSLAMTLPDRVATLVRGGMELWTRHGSRDRRPRHEARRRAPWVFSRWDWSTGSAPTKRSSLRARAVSGARNTTMMARAQ